MPKANAQGERPIGISAAEQGKATRARLMTAAVELIAEHGWGAVTTRMVADRAGLRPGLVHYHFASVSDLLIDASLAAAREMAQQVVAAVTAEHGREGLTRLLDSAAAIDADDPATTTFSEMLLAATRIERLRQGLAEVLAECRAAVADWLRREHAAVIDADASATLLLAALDGLILHALIDPSVRQRNVAHALRRLAGLATPGDHGGERP